MAARMRSDDASPQPAQLADGGKRVAVERDLFAKLAKSTAYIAVATERPEKSPTGLLVFNLGSLVLSRPSRSQKSRRLANAKVRQIASQANHDCGRKRLTKMPMTWIIPDHHD